MTRRLDDKTLGLFGSGELWAKIPIAGSIDVRVILRATAKARRMAAKALKYVESSAVVTVVTTILRILKADKDR
jgi:hypothetical protein